MYVVGTAGHVDHGKSSLVRALTGINPDRLREEQERQMTIDLGFAWVTLPSGREVSIVDVPGHEDFIRNMLAGVGSIDLALLVVAADEAVMPQTREHLAILDLMRVPRGVVALTKADLVEDSEWLDLVAEEVREAIAHSTLANAPIVPVSSVTGQGLELLLATLDDELERATPRPDLGSPRLPIDRVFSISGFGTVVTGTLIGGHLDVGDTVEIVPGVRRVRIRGLQSHKASVARALPGMRVAANLAGVEVGELRRGQVVCLPGSFTSTTLLDVKLQVLGDAARPITHGMMVDLYTGTTSAVARVRLLDSDALAPGQVGWAQVQLREPIVVSGNDRFVVRLPSPSATLGGGLVVDAHPARRYRRFDPVALQRMHALAEGDAPARLLAILDGHGPQTAAQLANASRLEPDEFQRALADLLAGGQAIGIGDEPENRDLIAWPGLVVSRATWNQTLEKAVYVLEAFQRAQPLRPGMPREELRSRIGLQGDWAPRFFERAQHDGSLVAVGDAISLPGHDVSLSPEEQRAVDGLMDLFRASPYTPPGWSEVEAAVGPAVAQYLVDSGRLVRVSDGVVFDAATFTEMIERLRGSIGPGHTFTVAQARDLFSTSRKYTVAFLEELDRRRITRRLGDERVLR